MDSVVQFLSHEYTDEREENSGTAIGVGSTSLQDVLVVFSVHLANAVIGIVIAALVLS